MTAQFEEKVKEMIEDTSMNSGYCELWKLCCNSWFDRRNEEYCPKCGKK
jgi:hypothetical protein